MRLLPHGPAVAPLRLMERMAASPKQRITLPAPIEYVRMAFAGSEHAKTENARKKLRKKMPEYFCPDRPNKFL